MKLSVEDIVDALGAKAHVILPDDRGLYLVIHDDDLYEEHRIASETINQDFISSDVPDSSPVAYLCGENTRVLYCKSDNDTLIRFKYDFTEETWEPLPLPEHAALAVDSDSRLAGCIDSSGYQNIFFQTSSGMIQGFKIDDTSASPLPSIHVPSKRGAPMFCIQGKDATHLWCLDPSNRIHYLTWAPTESSWQDTELPGAGFDTTEITSFMSIFETKDVYQILALSTEGKVFRVSQEGDIVHLGTKRNGKYRPAGAAENMYELVSVIHSAYDKIKKK